MLDAAITVLTVGYVEEMMGELMDDVEKEFRLMERFL